MKTTKNTTSRKVKVVFYTSEKVTDAEKTIVKKGLATKERIYKDVFAMMNRGSVRKKTVNGWVLFYYRKDNLYNVMAVKVGTPVPTANVKYYQSLYNRAPKELISNETLTVQEACKLVKGYNKLTSNLNKDHLWFEHRWYDDDGTYGTDYLEIILLKQKGVSAMEQTTNYAKEQVKENIQFCTDENGEIDWEMFERISYGESFYDED